MYNWLVDRLSRVVSSPHFAKKKKKTKKRREEKKQVVKSGSLGKWPQTQPTCFLDC